MTPATLLALMFALVYWAVLVFAVGVLVVAARAGFEWWAAR